MDDHTVLSFASRQSPVTDHEPEWLRDLSLGDVQLGVRIAEALPGVIAAVCENEFVYCEHCGEKSPMWPPKVSADHLVTVHGQNMTLQMRTGTGYLCEDTINQYIQMYFSAHFQTRISMRRRAWQLGYAVLKKRQNPSDPAN